MPFEPTGHYDDNDRYFAEGSRLSIPKARLARRHSEVRGIGGAAKLDHEAARAAMDHRPQKSTSTSTSRSVLDASGDIPNPTRLRLARKRRGLTQTALAKKIGVIRRAVVAHEAGHYSPSGETLDAMSNVLGFPIEFFYGDDIDVPSVDTGSFRSMKKMTAAQRDMALSQAALGIHLSGWLEVKFDLPAPDLPDLSCEREPVAAAATLRRMWGLGSLSIRNMIHLLESKGVRVFSLAVDAKEVDAFSMWKGKPFVFLNTHKTSEHSRFDAAHELGHLVMHKHGSPLGKELEKEANQFASAFLMPEGSVIAHRPRFPSYQTIVRIKKVWTTSVSATAYRLHELGLITEWQYRGLCVEIAKRGRSVEPDEAPRETSQILQKALKLLHGEGMGRSGLAQALNLPVSELENLLFGLAMSGIDGGGKRTPTPPAQLKRVK